MRTTHAFLVSVYVNHRQNHQVLKMSVYATSHVLLLVTRHVNEMHKDFVLVHAHVHLTYRLTNVSVGLVVISNAIVDAIHNVITDASVHHYHQ